jgi:hypothetical protein
MALAVATGRGDILGRDVQQGRVVYIAAENPDDLRMRLMVGAHSLGIKLSDLGGQLLIVSRKMRPETIVDDGCLTALPGNR